MLKIVYNVLCSLAFMHLTNVIHRDVKPANILISSDCNVKICDFGLSRSLPNRCKYTTYQRFEDQPPHYRENLNTTKLRSRASLSLQSKKTQGQSLWTVQPIKKELIANMLLEDRPRRKEMKRIMSLHVGSRWYRAPEISLVEKSYD